MARGDARTPVVHHVYPSLRSSCVHNERMVIRSVARFSQLSQNAQNIGTGPPRSWETSSRLPKRLQQPIQRNSTCLRRKTKTQVDVSVNADYEQARAMLRSAVVLDKQKGGDNIMLLARDHDACSHHCFPPRPRQSGYLKMPTATAEQICLKHRNRVD